MERNEDQAGRRIELKLHTACLPGASFEIVRARIHWGDGRTSEGWGRDADLVLAQTKALAEAVERHAQATLPVQACWQAGSTLPGAMAPQSLMRQAAHALPAHSSWRFDAASWWLPARSATDGSSAWVLADCVCNPRAFEPAHRTRLYTQATSCGTASGASLADALRRATLELVERDAFMRHWFMQCPGIAVAEASMPGWAASRLRLLAEGGCEAGVQCLDAGLHPVWLAWAQHPALHFTCVGAASGLEAEVALDAALNELDTHALARLAGVPPTRMRPEEVAMPADHAALYATEAGFRGADALLRPGPQARNHARTPIRFAVLAPGFRIHGDTLYARLQARGHPPHAVDLTLDAANDVLGGQPLYTVRAVVPGLIPMTFGHGQLPVGMWTDIDPRAHFPHPFA